MSQQHMLQLKKMKIEKLQIKTAQLYFEGMSYDEALKRARKIYGDHVKLKKNKNMDEIK